MGVKGSEQWGGLCPVCFTVGGFGAIVGLHSCYGQHGDFAVHKYDRWCYRHAFKTHRLQLENGSNCIRDFNCSKLNSLDHRIKFLVLIFKRTLILRSHKLLSKSFWASRYLLNLSVLRLLYVLQDSGLNVVIAYLDCKQIENYEAVRLPRWNTMLIIRVG